MFWVERLLVPDGGRDSARSRARGELSHAAGTSGLDAASRAYRLFSSTSPIWATRSTQPPTPIEVFHPAQWLHGAGFPWLPDRAVDSRRVIALHHPGPIPLFEDHGLEEIEDLRLAPVVGRPHLVVLEARPSHFPSNLANSDIVAVCDPLSKPATIGAMRSSRPIRARRRAPVSSPRCSTGWARPTSASSSEPPRSSSSWLRSPTGFRRGGPRGSIP